MKVSIEHATQVLIQGNNTLEEVLITYPCESSAIRASKFFVDCFNQYVADIGKISAIPQIYVFGGMFTLHEFLRRVASIAESMGCTVYISPRLYNN